MEKTCDNCRSKSGCNIIQSCKSAGNTYCRFHVQLWAEENLTTDADFESMVKPLIKYLCENRHPHTSIVVTQTSAERMEGIISIGYSDEYIKD